MSLACSLLIIALPSYAEITTITSQKLQDCAKIVDGSQRLECFDVLVKKLAPATAKKAGMESYAHAAKGQSIDKAEKSDTLSELSTSTVLTEKQQLEENFATPQSAKKKQEEVTDISLIISKLKKRIRGEWEITFTNGQVWLQKGSDRLSLKTGNTVVLSKGVFNAYYLKKAEGKKRIQVKRLK